MTKLAFISDIHSNLPALRATIKDIRSRGINRIYCLGDIIGYHTYTNEVIDLLKDENVISIKGNHDEAITMENFDRSRDEDFVLYWNFDRLTQENLTYLKHLPDYIEFSVEEVSICLVHGSPSSISEYIRENSAEASIYISEMKSDILLCAHTHLPYITKKDGKHLLNSGSVGKPKFGKPESSYIELSIDGKVIEPEIITVPYPVSEIVEDLKRHNFPKSLIKALETGNP
ncbi:metallophosphoesterase [Thiospirochaeta perfilievii]|uniref:Phosphoesterase n=1 Tax=Thiospirochaeta perfilievii TaxID=252967 RepID=A0A5C1QC42_9SPIO|nr:YfcE family phosphodiesterase [Thiospirochaeta perfilievii]QEN04898.1 metallophosphoesterase [Thiospirochaeta perfilievii]